MVCKGAVAVVLKPFQENGNIVYTMFSGPSE